MCSWLPHLHMWAFMRLLYAFFRTLASSYNTHVVIFHSFSFDLLIVSLFPWLYKFSMPKCFIIWHLYGYTPSIVLQLDISPVSRSKLHIIYFVFVRLILKYLLSNTCHELSNFLLLWSHRLEQFIHQLYTLRYLIVKSFVKSFIIKVKRNRFMIDSWHNPTVTKNLLDSSPGEQHLLYSLHTHPLYINMILRHILPIDPTKSTL